jgi:hypothetical protein
MDCLKEPPCKAITRGLKDDAVEKQVRGNEADAVAFAMFKVNDGLSEQGNVLGVGSFGRFGGKRRLHHEPHLGEFL